MAALLTTAHISGAAPIAGAPPSAMGRRTIRADFPGFFNRDTASTSGWRLTEGAVLGFPPIAREKACARSAVPRLAWAMQTERRGPASGAVPGSGGA